MAQSRNALEKKVKTTPSQKMKVRETLVESGAEVESPSEMVISYDEFELLVKETRRAGGVETHEEHLELTHEEVTETAGFNWASVAEEAMSGSLWVCRERAFGPCRDSRGAACLPSHTTELVWNLEHLGVGAQGVNGPNKSISGTQKC